MNVFHEEYQGRPKTATTEVLINKMMDDRPLTVIKIAEATDVSPEYVYEMLHEHLSMRKLNVRLVTL